MKVRVERQPSKKDWTLSTFYFNDVEMGKGVEDEKREIKVHGETRIPNGLYKMSMRNSPKFSRSYFRDDFGHVIRSKFRVTDELIERYHTPHELVWVLDVPNFEYILWHWGNTDDNTHGCYLVGSKFATIGGQNGVGSSRLKYEDIYPILWNAIKDEEVTVEYLTV